MLQTKEIRGVSSILLANVAFTAMVCLIRFADVENAGVTALFRFTTGALIIVALSFTGQVSLVFNNRKGLLWRGILGGTSVALSIVGITKLGIVKASVLINTYPLFATLFSILLLKEKPSKVTLGAITLAFTGVLLVLTPENSSIKGVVILNGATMLTLIGAIIGGFTVVQIKELSKSESNTAIYLSQCIAGVFIMLVPAGCKTVHLSPVTLFLLIGTGLFATIGQLCITEGIKHIDIATSSLLSMLGPILTIVAGLLIFKEPLTTKMFIGIILTFCALWTVTIPKKRHIQPH